MKNRQRIIATRQKQPELGTKEAAFKTCVDMIARMCGKPVDIVQYWLDLYFQTRLAYAVEEQQRRMRYEIIKDRLKVFADLSEDDDSAQEVTPDAEQAVTATEAEADGEAAAEAKAEEAPVAEGSVTPPPYGPAQ